MLIGIVALVAGCLGSVVGVVAALKWGPSNSGSTESAISYTQTPAAVPEAMPEAEAAKPTEPISPLPSAAPSIPATSAAPAVEPESLAFSESVAATDQSQWLLELDAGRPEAEGLTIKGSGAGSNYPLFMVRDFHNAPIAWIAPHGGLSVTDSIRVKSGVFNDDGVSMRRWTDNVELTGPGGFSWDGAELVTSSVGPSGSAQALPDAPELWLRIMDNTGDEPRYLVIPAFLEAPGN